MLIRPYRPGDEEGQVRVYNAATSGLPAYKAATAEEVAKRFGGSDPDPSTKFYAVEPDGDEMVAYAVFNANGRMSYPWCLPGHEAARVPLMETLLEAMRDRGFSTAWAAYRADWSPIVGFLEGHGFKPLRRMVNYIARTDELPKLAPVRGMTVGGLTPGDLPRLIEIGGGLFHDRAEHLQAFYWKNPYFNPDSLFAIRPIGGGPIRGAGLVVTDPSFADPSRIDPAMPCFRLGAMGTEAERLKRINGVVSFAFEDEAVGKALLSEASRRLVEAGVSLAAAQVPSDQEELIAFHDRYFDRQGEFPILSRTLARG